MKRDHPIGRDKMSGDIIRKERERNDEKLRKENQQIKHYVVS